MTDIKKLKVSVVTPEGPVFEGLADYVSLPGQEGVFGVFKRHVPVFTIIDQGEIQILNGGERQYLAVAGGFVDVGPDHVIVLADLASTSEALDEIKIQEAKKRAEEKLSEKLSRQDYLQAQAELRKALLDLKVHSRKRRPV